MQYIISQSHEFNQKKKLNPKMTKIIMKMLLTLMIAAKLA